MSFVPGNSYPTDGASIKRFKDYWNGWSATGAKLIFRPNLPGSGHNMPVSYVNWAYDSITYAHKSGRMLGSMIDSLLGEWGIQGFSYYVIGRLNINPETPLQQIYDEYCSAFGPAAAAVEKYWRYWEKVSNDVNGKSYRKFKREKLINWKKWLPIAPLIFTPEVMRHGRKLLEAAKNVNGLSPDEKKRLNFLDLGLQNAEKTLSVLKLWNTYLKSKNSGNLKRFAYGLRDLYQFRKKNDHIGLSNTGYLYLREGWTWDKRFLQYASPGSTGMTFKTCKTGLMPPKGSGWKLSNKDVKKYKIAELAGSKVFCLTATFESKSLCKATRILFDNGTKEFKCSIVMGWSGDSKDSVLSRVLLHANKYLWRGVELGFVRKQDAVFAGFRDGEIWRTLGPELKPNALYRCEIKSSGNGEKCELELLDANDRCLAAKAFKPHGGAVAVDAITLLVSRPDKAGKSNALFVKSIKAVPDKP